MNQVEELYSWKDDFARITLFNDESGFKKLNINNGLQFAERDEHRYHQSVFMLPSLFVSSSEQKVLILGGGDGLGARELAKLENISSIDLVDISEAMIFMSKQHPDMLSLNHDSLNNEKVTVHIEDSLEFIKRATENNQKWDLIVLDYPDPSVDFNSPINTLFSKEHYSDVFKLLKKGGVLSTQSTSVYISPNVFAKVSMNLDHTASSLFRLVINIQSFGDIGVIYARNEVDDNLEWGIKHDIPRRAFFTQSSISRFLVFLEDEMPNLLSKHIDAMDISDLIKYDISADFRRNANNYFISDSVPAYSRLIKVSEEESLDVYNSHKDIKCKEVKDIFVNNNYLLGYPNNGFDRMDEDDVFFNSMQTIKDDNGNIEAILKVREDEEFIESEYVYLNNINNATLLFKEYSKHIKKSNYKPLIITYWEHNVLTKNIVNKLGGTTIEEGFTWNIAIENIDMKMKPEKSITIDLEEHGTFVFNGILGCWETDWIDSKHLIHQMVRLCEENNIPNLSIFSKTPPVEYDYFRYKVAKVDYSTNKKIQRIVKHLC